MYQKNFKEDTPSFLERAGALIALHGDWYVGVYFSFIIIWGRNTVDLLARIDPEVWCYKKYPTSLSLMGLFRNWHAIKGRLGLNFH